MKRKNKKSNGLESGGKLSRSARNFIKPRLSKKGKMPDETIDPDAEIPRITNETVEEHRKEIIKGGRKYRYPIINTPKRIVGLSLVIGLISFLIFAGYTTLRLYRYNDYSDFMYNVTKVVPFPVARVGGSFVRYESYLFELRRSIHYFETQQGVDFKDADSQDKLSQERKRSLQQTVDQAYIRKLARQNDIKITSEEIDREIASLQEQNKLGDGSRGLEDVLQDFWGWSLDDYRRSIGQELLRQKVVQALDMSAFDTMEDIQRRIAAGEDFGQLAAEFSQDPATANSGGIYGFLLDREAQNEDPRLLDAAYDTPVDGVTGIINTGYTLEIVKVLGKEDDKIRAAHIMIPFNDITGAINDLKEEQPARVYISAN